jgi:hypothetical protein
MEINAQKHDPLRDVDIWWEEIFDAVILANGHYSVPYYCTSLPFLFLPLPLLIYPSLNPSSTFHLTKCRSQKSMV